MLKIISLTRTSLKIVRVKTVTMLILSIAFSVGSNYLFDNKATAQNSDRVETQSKKYVANVNEVKSFVYSWFALLDRQVSEISLLKFLDPDNLNMQFSEMTVSDGEEFSQWYLGVQKTIESNSHDVQTLEVTPGKNGEFDVKLVVDWQAKTRQGETITQTYLQQWKIVTDKRGRLLIRDYLVEEIE